MTIIARRLSKIKPSATMAVTRMAAQLRARGENVIGLGAGEPDFDTPDHIKAAAIRAIQAGKTKYTAVGGTDELKQAVQDKFARENNLNYDRSQIIVGCGGKQVIYNALVATLDAGDEVLIPAPYWVSYPDMALLAGGTPVILETKAENDFKLDADTLKAAITKRSKWLILNSPGNPTGALYGRDELQALARILINHPNLHILCDDMYEHIIYDDLDFSTIADVAPELSARILTVNGVSKAYAMTGWRIGFAGGDPDLIKAMTTIQSQSTSNPCSISQAAAVAALTGPQDFIPKRAARFCKRRDTLYDSINAITGLSCVNRPQGAFYLFFSCADVIGRKTPDGQTIGSDTDYAGYLLGAAKVALVPGTAFGAPGYLRASYATSDEALAEACVRMAKANRELT